MPVHDALETRSPLAREEALFRALQVLQNFTADDQAGGIRVRGKLVNAALTKNIRRQPLFARISCGQFNYPCRKIRASCSQALLLPPHHPEALSTAYFVNFLRAGQVDQPGK